MLSYSKVVFLLVIIYEHFGNFVLKSMQIFICNFSFYDLSQQQYIAM